MKGETNLNYMLATRVYANDDTTMKTLVCRSPQGSTLPPAGETNCSARSSMYSMISTLICHLASFASSTMAGLASYPGSPRRVPGYGWLKSLGQLALQYQLLETVAFHTLTTVHSNPLAPLVLAWFLAPKKKERLVSTVYALISS